MAGPLASLFIVCHHSASAHETSYCDTSIEMTLCDHGNHSTTMYMYTHYCDLKSCVVLFSLVSGMCIVLC